MHRDNFEGNKEFVTDFKNFKLFWQHKLRKYATIVVL